MSEKGTPAEAGRGQAGKQGNDEMQNTIANKVIIPSLAQFNNSSVSPRQKAYLLNYRQNIGQTRFNAALTLIGIDSGDLHSLSAFEADRLLKIIQFTIEGGDVS